MFWTLPVISVGQEANESRLTQPLRLAAANELVENDLGDEERGGGGGEMKQDGEGMSGM